MRRLFFMFVLAAALSAASSCGSNQFEKRLEVEADKLQLHMDGDTFLPPGSAVTGYFERLSALIPADKKAYLLYLLDASCSVCIDNYLFFTQVVSHLDDAPRIYVAIPDYEVQKVEYYAMNILGEGGDIGTVIPVAEEFPFIDGMDANVRIPNVLYISDASVRFAADVFASESSILYSYK